MNSTARTVLIVLVVIVVAAALFFAGYVSRGLGAFAGTAGERAFAPYPQFYGGPGMMGNWNRGFGAGPGMMGSGERGFGIGPGMMGNWERGFGAGPGMMGNWDRGFGMGPGMMGGYAFGGAPTVNAVPLRVDEVRQAASDYVEGLGIDGLDVGEIMIFDNNGYAVVKETSTGLGAFELLVDPVSKVAYPEHGPNMMWNLKYGGINHRGMMGGGGMMGLWQYQSSVPEDVSAEMPVSADDARKAAQDYLDQYQNGAVVSADGVQFYGYYTFDFEQAGSVAGMLGVNGFNGQVFLHTWHGTFLEESE